MPKAGNSPPGIGQARSEGFVFFFTGDFLTNASFSR